MSLVPPPPPQDSPRPQRGVGRHAARPEDEGNRLSVTPPPTPLLGVPAPTSVRPSAQDAPPVSPSTSRTSQVFEPPAPEETPLNDPAPPRPVSSSGPITGTIPGVALPGMTPREEHANRETAPVRRSLRERMASASNPLAEPPAITGANPLTRTNMGLPVFTDTDSAFQIDADGTVSSADALAPIAAAVNVEEPAHVIDVERARTHHLFLVSDSVDPAELEALAISMWDEAGWSGPGHLSLSSSASLEGPWSLDQETRAELGTPVSLTNAWILECPASPTTGGMGMGEWAKAFPQGMPTGLEYRVLEALSRMARRLAGGLRLAGSGYVMVPDADSAVNLMVYSPRWIDPADLLNAMHVRANFPEMKDSRDVAPVQAAPTLTPAQVAHIEKLKEQLGPIRHDIASKIAKAREEMETAAKEPQVVDGYALMSPIGKRSDMMIEVHAVPAPPRVLRWEPWTAGAIVEYQVRWLPGGALTPGAGGLSRTARLERLRCAQDIERAAGMIATLVGGNVIDEDGFLVGLEEIAPDEA